MACCVFCSVISCTDKTQRISYSTATLDMLASKNVIFEKVSEGVQFVTPMQIIGLNDSLLVVFDIDADKKCKLLNTSGMLLGEFAQLGHSNDELISPVGISVDDKSMVNVYDYSSRMLISYSIPDVIKGKTNSLRRINIRQLLENNKIEKTGINYVQSIDSDHHILFGNNRNRIMLLDGEKINNIYKVYPGTDSDEECNWAIWGYSVQYGLSPDHKHLVLTTYVGALFEIFNIEDGNVVSSTLKGFFPPSYDIAIGAIPKWISPDADSPEGFCALCTTNDRFYASIGGIDCVHRNEIYSFDYNGNAIGKYVLPGDLTCFTLLNDYFYFIIENKNGEYELYKAGRSEFL